MAREKPKVTVFKDETADRLLQGLPGVVEKGKAGASSPNKKFQKEEQYEVLTAKIVSDDENGYYTCEEVVFDNSEMNEEDHDFDVQDYLRKEIKVRETAGTAGIAVDTIVKLTPEAMIDKTIIWTFTQGGGGSVRKLIMLTADSVSTNIGEFVGQEIEDRTTMTPVGDPLTVWAPQMTGGSLPTSGSDSTRFWRADEVPNTEGIVDASGAVDPPANIYEIFPNVWY
jgi:hypothetical protein